MENKTSRPDSIEDLIDLLKTETSILPTGGGTKPALTECLHHTTLVDMRGISGIVEYQSSEYTITVKGGTPLSEIKTVLKENGQYLPFDPPLANKGATVAGSVAAGLSGPGAYRYGPLKDFIIGVRFVDGMGNHVKGGGKVVKNAAGFDFPKLFNGSIGRLGIITELSFKVFPEPQAYVTLKASFDSPSEALAIMPKLLGFDLEGVELNAFNELLLRLGYQEPTMAARKAGLEKIVGRPLQIVIGYHESETWTAISDFDWKQADCNLFKTATTTTSANQLLEALKHQNPDWHLSNGGKSLYLASSNPDFYNTLDQELSQLHLSGLQLAGSSGRFPILGKANGLSFVNRIQKALDPNKLFLPFTAVAAETAK